MLHSYAWIHPSVYFTESETLPKWCCHVRRFAGLIQLHAYQKGVEIRHGFTCVSKDEIRRFKNYCAIGIIQLEIIGFTLTLTLTLTLKP